MVTSEPIIRGLKLFKQMYDIGMPQGMDGATATKAFSGMAGCSQLAEWAVVNVYKTNNPATYNDPAQRHHAVAVAQIAGALIHPLTVNAQSPNNGIEEAAKEFFTFLYRQQNYQQLLQRALFDIDPDVPG